MNISKQLLQVKEESVIQSLKLGAKIREQQALISKLSELTEEVMFIRVALDDLHKQRGELEMVKRVSEAERKITDLDCRILKMGARLT
ncbi:hypothetical protein BI001_gp166 [Bacillus phage Zuko]|uniref:hypothetical protein n=1 Tax=Bacillus phage Zuko TaxID=1805956 RepID=UPI0007A774E5|nr:hypothetical protein BI001_gp166 [Bacillus phage Zuko]AMW62367.1 hypothetical protein ZUKO_212 [Bacillus phage Zuko]